MPFLFSYGTLQHERVQLTTFGRRLRGEPDELPRFERTLVRIMDPVLEAAGGPTHHANVTFNGDERCHVEGTAFEVTEAELTAADRYERPAHYTRTRVTLASGREAWVYQDASQGWDAVADTLIAVRNRSIGVAVVRAWARGLSGGASVLDVGCGSGVPLGQALAADGFRLFGVDASRRLIDAFNTNVPGAAAACEPAERSSFFGRRFDGAIVIGLLFLLPGETQRHLLRTIARVLQPGGRLLFTAPRQACTWTDVLTGGESRSLGVAAYAEVLADEGVSIDDGFTDEGENHYCSCIAVAARGTS